MDVAYISAISALAGSFIGGVTTGATTWLSQRTQARASHIAHEVSRREDLIRDFIIAASKTYGDALVNSEPQMQELVGLYALVSRMRVLTMPESVAAADRLLRATVDTYFEPNRTIVELHEVLKTGAGVDPLREFSEAARKELSALSAFF
jgi:hypothetical protein